MPSDIIQTALAFRKKIEELASIAGPSMDDAKRLDYISFFPSYDPNTEGYGLHDIVVFDGLLYENLLSGNKLSPSEYKYAWRYIDPEFTNMEEL